MPFQIKISRVQEEIPVTPQYVTSRQTIFLETAVLEVT